MLARSSKTIYFVVALAAAAAPAEPTLGVAAAPAKADRADAAAVSCGGAGGDAASVPAPPLRRCFVCSDGQAWPEAPAHVDRCVQVLIPADSLCDVLVNEDRLRSEKDTRMREAEMLEISSTREATAKARSVKLEVAILWSALRKVIERKTEEMWNSLFDAMGDSMVDLGKKGLPEAAERVRQAGEVLAKAHVPRLRTRSFGAGAAQGRSPAAGGTPCGTKVECVGSGASPQHASEPESLFILAGSEAADAPVVGGGHQSPKILHRDPLLEVRDPLLFF